MHLYTYTLYTYTARTEAKIQIINPGNFCEDNRRKRKHGETKETKETTETKETIATVCFGVGGRRKPLN